MQIRTVGIIGLGLIGGSLAKALRYYGVAERILAYNRSEESILKALKDGSIDARVKEFKGFSKCDIIFICTPVDYIKDMLIELSKYVNSDCIVTDVGSTKDEVMRCAQNVDCKYIFIGGHPMAGSEKTGYNAAKYNLFENAYYVLTPPKGCPEKALNKIKDIVLGIHAIPIILPPNVHDYTVAAISHVPHVMAALLVNIVSELDSDKKYMHMLAAGGFKDLTRIASSSPKIWESICFSNKDRIVSILEYLKKSVEEFIEKLKNEDEKYVADFFTNARRYRDTFSDQYSGALMKAYDIVVDIEDKPGAIAHVATILSSQNINIRNISILHNRETEEGVLEISFYDSLSQQNGLEILKNKGFSVSKK